MSIKIAVVGAGSVGFTRAMIHDILCIPELRDAQVSLLIGPHFADLATLVENYLPKPALDYITGRMTELLLHRPKAEPPATSAAAVAGGDSF